MSNPHNPGEVVVTIKQHGGYDATWFVFRGTAESVREQIIAFFGIDSASVTDLSLHGLVTNATQIAHGVSTVAEKLGGVVVPEDAAEPSEGPSSASEGDAWANVSDSPAKNEPEKAEVDPNAWILTQIEDVTNVADLQKLWAENQTIFVGPVMDAYKVKGKALTAA